MLLCNSKQYRKPKHLVDDQVPCREAFGLGQTKVQCNAMAIEARRNKLINELIGRNFTAKELVTNVRGPAAHTEPLYMATSSRRIPQISANVSPVLSNMQWPTTNADKVDLLKNEYNSSMHRCKCENCTSPNCPGKFRHHSGFGRRNKIISFHSQCTMTPSLADAACGNDSTAMYSSETYDAAVSATSTRRRHRGSIYPHDDYKCLQYPMSILKKNDNNKKGILLKENTMHNESYKAERDLGEVENTDKSPIKHVSIDPDEESQYSVKDQATDAPRTQRKVLYNEGISDTVAELVAQHGIDAATFDRASRGPLRHKNLHKMDSYIPYSHMTSSKYHNKCKHTPFKTPVYSELDVVEDYPPLLNLSQVGFPSYDPSKNSCRPPKKVLSSEKDIEAYIQGRRNHA